MRKQERQFAVTTRDHDIQGHAYLCMRACVCCMEEYMQTVMYYACIVYMYVINMDAYKHMCLCMCMPKWYLGSVVSLPTIQKVKVATMRTS